MIWYDLKNLANENQGVIAVFGILITVLTSIFVWLKKKIHSEKKERIAQKDQQQVNPIVYTSEGHNFGQVNISQNNYYNSGQLKQSKINTIKEQANLSILQVTHFKFYLIKIKDSQFVIRDDDLHFYLKDYEKDENNCSRISKNDLIELLKRFTNYDDEEEKQNIKLNYSLYDFIVDQLAETNLSILIDTNDTIILSIPFNNLSASDFNISNKRFSININRKL
jgi:hypothetical protein